MSAEDEASAEFVCWVDLEAVLTGSVCHASDFGYDGGMAIRFEFLDDSGLKAGTNDRIVDEGLPQFELSGSG